MNNLTIVIRSTLVNNRSQADITFEGYTNSLCNAPGVNWVRTIDNATCEEVYTGNLDWSLLSSSCGLSQANYSNEIIFSGTILVYQVDLLSEINNQNITRGIDTPVRREQKRNQNQSSKENLISNSSKKKLLFSFRFNSKSFYQQIFK